MTTETDLSHWRDGSTKAERLCAGILGINGYVDIEPQAPIGGPDGKADILAKRDGSQYLGAVFFPSTPQSFAAIKGKFVGDRQGVARHKAAAFVFLVNQPLTIGQRQTLRQLGEPADDLFDLERLRLALDSPKGYGLRLEYLRRAMSIEEQTSFLGTLGEDPARRLAEQRRDAKTDLLLHRTESIARHLGVPQGPSSLDGPDAIGPIDAPVSELKISTLQLLHRALTENAPSPTDQQTLRNVHVWVGDAEAPTYEPPDPEEVPSRLTELLTWWQEHYPLAVKGGPQSVVPALARLHHGIVSIHPFLDGNGRLARFVTDQAAREMLGRSISHQMTKNRKLYFASLKAGDDGDLGPLETLIQAALN